MTKALERVLPSLLFALIFAILPTAAFANPMYYANGTSTAAATTSPTFMSPGAGTTTSPIYDSFADTVAGGFTYRTDYVGLLGRLAGSSTNSVLTICPEYSQNRIDWYRDFVLDPTQIGTTTPFSVVNPNCVTWRFASSTVGGAAVTASTGATSTAAMIFSTPFRYTRFVYSIAGAAANFWAQLVPLKQAR